MTDVYLTELLITATAVVPRHGGGLATHVEHVAKRHTTTGATEL